MIKKAEIIVWSILGLFYINMITGMLEQSDAPGLSNFIFLTCILFLIIGGYSLYKQKDDQTKSALPLAIICGIAFSTGFISFTSNIWNHSNFVALCFLIPNVLVSLYLLYYIIRYRKTADVKIVSFRKGLLIRSAILFVIFILIISLPYPILNIYLNRNNQVLHNRGLAEQFLQESLEYTEAKQYKEAIASADNAAAADKIGWETDNSDTYKINLPYYEAYWGLMNDYFNKNEMNKVIELYPMIVKPIHICYGDSSLEQAQVLKLLGRANQTLSFYDRADSLYDSSLKIYLHYYGYKNLYYAITLKHIGNSYYEQNYYGDAIKIYKDVINIMEKDTTIYSANGSEENGKTRVINFIALSNADIGQTFSFKGMYDSADVYFGKAFETESFVDHDSYPTALTNYAFHKMNKGDLIQSLTLMQKALTITLKNSGEISYSYLRVLSLLNQLNTTLSNYTGAEKGCLRALAIVAKLNTKQDDYYASLLLDYANVKNQQGDYEKAKELMEKALVSTDAKSLQYADILQSLSSLYADLSEYHQAFDFGKEASRLAQAYFVSNTNQYLTKYIRNEAYTHYILGSTKQGEPLYKRCYTIDTLNKTSDKLSFAGTLNGLGLIKTRNKAYKIADTLYNASLDLYKSHTGESNTDYATVLYNNAYLKMDEGKLLEAQELLSTSQHILLKVLGDKHDKVADNYLAFGKLKVKEKKYEEAVSYFNQAFSIYKLKFKSTHHKYIESQYLIDQYQNK